MTPFEFPAPTPLEQRSASVDDASGEDDAYYEEADDDEGDVDMNGTETQFDEADEDEAAKGEIQDAEDQPEPEPSPEPEPAPATPATTGASSTPFGRDGLTGLLDPMAFDEAMSHEEAREQRYGHPATVIVFELDGLAKLVDRLGAEPGDRIETALGDAIKRLARRADYVARLERGRYAALLPETDEVAAINYVERIRRACDLWLESGAIAMRLAIGWASTSGDAGLTGAVRVATDRMRAELRRNARGVGDETAGVDELDASQPAEAASGI
jgi:diguanylate cyclase (GGDEF)-like protein